MESLRTIKAIKPVSRSPRSGNAMVAEYDPKLPVVAFLDYRTATAGAPPC